MSCSFRTFGIADYPAGSVFGPRLNRDFELVWIERGHVTWHVEGQQHRLGPGSIVLTHPGMTDGFDWDKHGVTRHGYCHFHIADPLLSELPAIEDWRLAHVPHSNSVLPKLIDHLSLLSLSDAPRWQRNVVLTTIVAAFITERDGLWSTSIGSELPKPLELLMQTVAEAWEDGIYNPLATENLVVSVGVSRAHLSRLCREYFECTPQDLLMRLRTDHAANLLLRTNLSVQSIAERCGFSCAFHFSKRFSRAFGVSPRLFRQAPIEITRKRHAPIRTQYYISS